MTVAWKKCKIKKETGNRAAERSPVCCFENDNYAEPTSRLTSLPRGFLRYHMNTCLLSENFIRTPIGVQLFKVNPRDDHEG